jgi:hypothetical protein
VISIGGLHHTFFLMDSETEMPLDKILTLVLLIKSEIEAKCDVIA